MRNGFYVKARYSFVVPVIIAINVVVFGLWNLLPNLHPFLAENFLVSWNLLADGRVWTLWGSVFSHFGMLHIFINMFVLNSFGRMLEMVMGPGRFLTFYLLAGAVASLSHSVVSAFVLHDPSLPALGASGAVAGLVLLFSLMYPREKILLFAIIPLPAIWAAALFVALDLWGLWAQAQGGGLPIGYGAHLGGAFTGAIYYLLFVRPRRRPSWSGAD